MLSSLAKFFRILELTPSLPVYIFACLTFGIGILHYKRKQISHRSLLSCNALAFQIPVCKAELLTTSAKAIIYKDKVEFVLTKDSFPAVLIVVNSSTKKAGKFTMSEFLFEGKLSKNTFEIFENAKILPNVAIMVVPSTPVAESTL